MRDLSVNLCGVHLQNPLLMASGTFGFGEEYAELIDVSRLGGICSKGLTLHPREGNFGPRMWESPAGMLNSVGLQNPGVRHFIDHELKSMKRLNPVAIANLGGSTLEEYVEAAELLDGAEISMLELNISCPNVKHGGAAFGQNSGVAAGVVSAVRNVFRGSLMVKLSPHADDIADMARACEAAGADALSLINTIKGMAIDLNMRRPVFRNTVAGLSGPCLRPIALRMVFEAAQAVKIPVVGLGGIARAEDVLEFVMAGAMAVQIGTANFANPAASLEILEQLPSVMERFGIRSLDEIRGAAWQ